MTLCYALTEVVGGPILRTGAHMGEPENDTCVGNGESDMGTSSHDKDSRVRPGVFFGEKLKPGRHLSMSARFMLLGFMDRGC